MAWREPAKRPPVMVAVRVERVVRRGVRMENAGGVNASSDDSGDDDVVLIMLGRAWSDVADCLSCLKEGCRVEVKR